MGKRILLGFLLFIFVLTNGWQLYSHNKAKFKNDYQSHKAAFEEISRYIIAEAEKYEGARYMDIEKDPFGGYYEAVSYMDGKRNVEVDVVNETIKKRLFIPLHLLRYNFIRYDYNNHEIEFIAYISEYNDSIRYRFGWIYSPLRAATQVKESQELGLRSDKFINAGRGWYYYKTIDDVSDNYDNEKIHAIQKKVNHTIIFFVVIFLIHAWDKRSRKRKEKHEV